MEMFACVIKLRAVVVRFIFVCFHRAFLALWLLILSFLLLLLQLSL